MRHIARKRFGQHFLVDEAVITAIVAAINPRPGQALVEIGPGLGALTGGLRSLAGRLTVIELDRDLAARLRGEPGLAVVEADVLDVDFAALARQLGQPLRVVGNLPYNISTPILFHLLAVAGQVQDQHFMLQKEVVDRMVAEPGSKDFGRLSVMLQYRFHMERMFVVPPGAFNPPPRVDSAIVRMIPVDFSGVGAGGTASDSELFARVVTAAFSQRRKMLRNTLRGYLDEAALAALGIPPTARAEDIPVADYVRLANSLADLGRR